MLMDWIVSEPWVGIGIKKGLKRKNSTCSTERVQSSMEFYLNEQTDPFLSWAQGMEVQGS